MEATRKVYPRAIFRRGNKRAIKERARTDALFYGYLTTVRRILNLEGGQMKVRPNLSVI